MSGAKPSSPAGGAIAKYMDNMVKLQSVAQSVLCPDLAEVAIAALVEVRTALTDAGLETITTRDDVERVTGNVWAAKLFSFWEKNEWSFDIDFHKAQLRKKSNIS